MVASDIHDARRGRFQPEQACRCHQDQGCHSTVLFGSTVRNEAVQGSDLDVFIDYDLSKNFSLLDLVGITQFLEDHLSVEVDVTTRSSLHPMLRTGIETSAIRIF